jgi:hypothetical protein
MNPIKKTKPWLVSAGIGLALASVAGSAALAREAKMIQLTQLGDMKWTPLMDGPLPAVAPIDGNAAKGAYVGYLKLPAGFVSPPHTHSSDYWSVLVQGKMTHWPAAGGSEKDGKPLGVGDLTFMPGKVEHVSKCYPGQDCILVVMQKGKFDFLTKK